MKRAFLALAFSDVILMLVTGGVGLALSNTPHAAAEAQHRYFTVHFLLGLLTALYTCFVLVASFMYFAVCYKIIQQSAAGPRGDGESRFAVEAVPGMQPARAPRRASTTSGVDSENAAGEGAGRHAYGSLAGRYVALKSRALRAAAAGIVATLVAVGLGAAINVYVTPTAHLVGAFACIAITAGVYVYLYTLIHESTQLFSLIGEAEPEQLKASPGMNAR